MARTAGPVPDPTAQAGDLARDLALMARKADPVHDLTAQAGGPARDLALMARTAGLVRGPTALAGGLVRDLGLMAHTAGPVPDPMALIDLVGLGDRVTAGDRLGRHHAPAQVVAALGPIVQRRVPEFGVALCLSMAGSGPDATCDRV